MVESASAATPPWSRWLARIAWGTVVVLVGIMLLTWRHAAYHPGSTESPSNLVLQSGLGGVLATALLVGVMFVPLRGGAARAGRAACFVGVGTTAASILAGRIDLDWDPVFPALAGTAIAAFGFAACSLAARGVQARIGFAALAIGTAALLAHGPPPTWAGWLVILGFGAGGLALVMDTLPSAAENEGLG